MIGKSYPVVVFADNLGLSAKAGDGASGSDLDPDSIAENTKKSLDLFRTFKTPLVLVKSEEVLRDRKMLKNKEPREKTKLTVTRILEPAELELMHPEDLTQIIKEYIG